MKILFLTNLYPPYSIGGYELICESVSHAMQAQGHETFVLTSDHKVLELGSLKERNVRRSLRVHGFFGHPWLGIGKLCGLELHNNSELRKAVEHFQPDVIHVFNLGGISKSLTHTLDRLDIPTVYFVSDHWITKSLDGDVWLDWWNRPASSKMQGLARDIFARAGLREKWDADAPTQPAADVKFRRIYFCSEFLRKKAIAYGRDVSHSAVIHNSVDTQKFHGKPAPLGSTFERLLFVGRLTPEKGIKTVLNAVNLLRDRFPGTLTICGRGEKFYERELHRFVQTNNLPVKFVHATAAEMPAIYRQHDALIFASEWEEPFALTPLEAMACGLPVISTTTGGSAELFQHGKNALTFKAGSEIELAQQIVALHRIPELRDRVARAGYAEVRELYSEQTVMERVEGYLQETVDSWRAASPLVETFAHTDIESAQLLHA